MRHLPVPAVATLVLLVSASVIAQDVINIDGVPCGRDGSARSERVRDLDFKKNRYDIPTPGDFDRQVTLQAIMQPGDDVDHFREGKAAEVVGYVYNVKEGGIESCNCETRDPLFRDTHIELTGSDRDTLPSQRVIVEVTPRLRQMMARRGLDWTTPGLREGYKGKWVRIQGWLFFDAEHLHEATNTHPSDTGRRRNWRATVWEIHPVTSIELLSGPPAAQAPAPGTAGNAAARSTATVSRTNQALLTVGLCVLLVLAGQILRIIVTVAIDSAHRRVGQQTRPMHVIGRLVLALVFGIVAGTALIVTVPGIRIGWGAGAVLALVGFIGPDFVLVRGGRGDSSLATKRRGGHPA